MMPLNVFGKRDELTVKPAVDLEGGDVATWTPGCLHAS